MAEFTIRVELKGNPTYQDYEKLHAQMASVGFLRYVAGVNNKNEKAQFDLPTALYFGLSDQSASTVRDRVTAKAQTIQSSIIVFVAETINWAYNNTN
jgi:hypothetical protein